MKRLAILAAAAALAAACASTPQKYCARTPFGLLAVSPVQALAPEPGRALVVFFQWDLTTLCPESGKFDREFPPSVYHLKGDDQELLGFLDMGGKVGYQAAPGKHTFMVNGVENVDFLAADLEAGKTYRVFVTAYKVGVNSRFRLVPIRRDPSAPSDHFHGHPANVQEEWVTTLVGESLYVEKTAKARDWYDGNKAKLDEKRRATLPRWEAAAARGQKDDRTLHADDGV